MAATALYRALVEAGASESTALEATQEMERDFEARTGGFVTKVYLDERLDALEARLSEKLTWRMMIFAGVIIAAVGLMIKL